MITGLGKKEGKRGPPSQNNNDIAWVALHWLGYNTNFYETWQLHLLYGFQVDLRGCPVGCHSVLVNLKRCQSQRRVVFELGSKTI